MSRMSFGDLKEETKSFCWNAISIPSCVDHQVDICDVDKTQQNVPTFLYFRELTTLSALLDPLSMCNSKRHHTRATDKVIPSVGITSHLRTPIHSFRDGNPLHIFLHTLPQILFSPWTVFEDFAGVLNLGNVMTTVTTSKS